MICSVTDCPDETITDSIFCKLHARRALAGLVRQDEHGNWHHYCAKGHHLTEATIRWESAGKNGARRLRCRECLRDKAKRQVGKKRKHLKPYRPTDLKLTNAIVDFDKAKREVTTNCATSPDKFMDWMFMGFPDEEQVPQPTSVEARAWCRGCPLLKACANYRSSGKIQDGIWGGEMWVDGEKATA